MAALFFVFFFSLFSFPLRGNNMYASKKGRNKNTDHIKRLHQGVAFLLIVTFSTVKPFPA